MSERSDNGNSLLMYAISKTNRKAVEFLVEQKVHVDYWNEQAEGATALHLSVILGECHFLHFFFSLFQNFVIHYANKIKTNKTQDHMI